MAIWSHLPKRKGLVSGFILTGIGMGAMVFGLLVNYIINPDNISPSIADPFDPTAFYFPNELASKVPGTIQTLCVIWACQAVLNVLLVSNYVKPVTSTSASGVPLMEGETLKSAREIAEEKTPISTLLASKYFWQIFIGLTS